MSENAPIDPSLVQGAISDLWRFYDEHAAQARQHETLRAAVTTLLAGFAATIVGTVTSDGFQRDDVLAGALVMAIGFVGALLSLKHYERNRFHMKVLKVTRDEITLLRRAQGSNVGAKSTRTLRKRAKANHARTFSLFGERGQRDERERSGPVADADKERDEDVPKTWLVATRLWVLWLALPIVIMIAGAVIVVCSLV
jgi:hypothetical protein